MRVADFLSERKMSKTQFARGVQCSSVHVARIVNGFEPSPPLARRIIAFTGGAVTLADLYPTPTAEDAA